jgi:cytochrome c oxidase subunit I
MVYAIIFLGFMSSAAWAHHMFLTGMGTVISAFFQTTTMIISLPSAIVLTALLLSLYGGSIRFNTPILFALAFLPMFGIGGLLGLPPGLASSDIPLHDTMYVVGHFHFAVAPGTIFALFAGIYYWYPKITGRMMNEALGWIHFAGVNRRLFDGGMTYVHAQPLHRLQVGMSYAAWALAPTPFKRKPISSLAREPTSGTLTRSGPHCRQYERTNTSHKDPRG